MDDAIFLCLLEAIMIYRLAPVSGSDADPCSTNASISIAVLLYCPGARDWTV